MRKVLIFCILFAGWQSLLAGPGRNIMLVLGSADSVVLKNRMQVAMRLYTKENIDRIIVSGGCGAHGSSICEASMMMNLLLKNGVPQAKIYKEENSKTTVQNYVFSRKLKDESGQPVISPGDTVYVVSDHWHAISVAARLKKYDKVEAKFFIEGSIMPKATDKLDYVGIFNGEPDNEKFVLKGNWLTPEAAWQQGDSVSYLTGCLVYTTDVQNKSFSYKPRDRVFPQLESYTRQQDLTFIDAGTHWYVWTGEKILHIDKQDRKVKKVLALNELVSNLPAQWQKSLKAGCIYGDKLLLFSNNGLLIGRKNGKTYRIEEESTAPRHFSNWPYGWGQGNVSAVRVDTAGKKVYVYRNMEFLELNADLKEASAPKPLRLKWIDDLK